MKLLETDDPQLTMQATALFAPDLLAVPDEWFAEFPDWFGEIETNKIWVDSEGRAAGRTYGRDTCLIDGNETECWTPEPSPTEYEAFHQGATPTKTGAVVATGVIGGGRGHAPDHLGFDAAYKFYADTDQQLLVGRAFDLDGEGYFLGAVLPDVTVGEVAKVRRSALSCDWRWRVRDAAGRALNAYDNLGPWLVTRPGLPLDRRGFQRAPSMRFRALTASAGPPAIIIDYESEPAMHDNPTCDGNCHCKPPVTAASDMAPAAVTEVSDTIELRAMVESLTETVGMLSMAVAELVAGSIELDEVMD